jgi:choline dehydrogenase-like flavoprotein
MNAARQADVLIVGGGIMGAATAALLREADPHLIIAMVDAGPAIVGNDSRHLHESTDPETWLRYNQRVGSGIQGLYAGDPLEAVQFDAEAILEPGVHRLGYLGQDADEMPGAALAWNAGGMGVHWTAATPWPDETERFGDESRWDRDLAEARRLLKVTPSPIGPTAVGQRVLDVLHKRLGDLGAPDRLPQPMPMAVQPVGDRLERSGPGAIFPPITVGGDDNFTLDVGTAAVELLHDEGRLTGARVRTLATGEEYTIEATTTVVCADAMRTPQLLFASGIRPAALGHYLSEHAFISNRVVMDLDRFGIALDELPPLPRDEFVTDSLWLPRNGEEQPFQAQVMNRTYVDDESRPIGYGVGLSLYVPLPVRAENRIEFSEDATDIAGLPRMRIRFSYDDDDLAMIDRGRAFVAEVAGDFGDFDPVTESALLPAGSSLHFTGTVRSGEADDGTSVCDPSGRVWGFDNLYVAGNGVIPTSLACNSTLTGVVTAIRAAEAITHQRAALEAGASRGLQ